MPPKPLEGTLQKFKEEQIKLFNRTPQDESVQLGMLSEHMIRQVWAEALRYGASVLPENEKETTRHVVCSKCGSEQWEYTSHHSVYGYSLCCGKKNVDGGEKIVDRDTDKNYLLNDIRTALLEEADKATK